jgi:two-component system phosphate regulon response regulator OmpR
MRRVLLVEDNALVAEAITRILQDGGYQVETVSTFAEGRAKLEGDNFDLLIADAMLPGGNGADLAAMAEGNGTKHLLVTGHPDQMEAFERKGQRYLPKPFTPSTLLDHVEQCWRD